MSAAKDIKKHSAQFLKTTLQMIDDNHPDGCVRWGSEGRSFIIHNPEKFLKALPQYFKTKNYSSFVRQLNMYDFHKVKNAEGLPEFRHEYFIRGCPDLLGKIKRKVYDLSNENSELIDMRLIYLEKTRTENKLSDLNDTLNILRSQNTSLQASCMDICKTFEGFKKSFDAKMSKVFLQFLSMMQTYTPSVFDENGKSLKGKELKNVEKPQRSALSENSSAWPTWGNDEPASAEKEKTPIYSLQAEQATPHLPNYPRQNFNQPLMILNKESRSSSILDHLKIDSFPASPAGEFSRGSDNGFYADNNSWNSVISRNFDKQHDALLMTPDLRDESS